MSISLNVWVCQIFIKNIRKVRNIIKFMCCSEDSEAIFIPSSMVTVRKLTNRRAQYSEPHSTYSSSPRGWKALYMPQSLILHSGVFSRLISSIYLSIGIQLSWSNRKRDRVHRRRKTSSPNTSVSQSVVWYSEDEANQSWAPYDTVSRRPRSDMWRTSYVHKKLDEGKRCAALFCNIETSFYTKYPPVILRRCLGSHLIRSLRKHHRIQWNRRRPDLSIPFLNSRRTGAVWAELVTTVWSRHWDILEYINIT